MVQKNLIDLEEKCLRNSRIFLKESFSLHIYSHLVKKLELSELCRKKNYGALTIMNMTCSKKVTLLKKRHIFCSFSISVAR